MLIHDNIVNKFFDEYVAEIQERTNQRDQNPSGNAFAPKRSFEDVSDSVRSFKLIGWQYIYQSLEVGRGKTVNSGDGSLRRNIKKWLTRKTWAMPMNEADIEQASWAISTKIHKEGTRLFRNQDDRFSRPSGTITDTINQANLQKLVKKLGTATRLEIVKDLKKLLENDTSNQKPDSV